MSPLGAIDWMWMSTCNTWTQSANAMVIARTADGTEGRYWHSVEGRLSVGALIRRRDEGIVTELAGRRAERAVRGRDARGWERAVCQKCVSVGDLGRFGTSSGLTSRVGRGPMVLPEEPPQAQVDVTS